MLTSKMIETIKNIFEKVDILIATEELEYEDWKKAGCPRIIKVVEEKNGYTAVLDVAYNHSYIFKGEQLIANGGNECIANEVIFLDKEYYRVSKYLWF